MARPEVPILEIKVEEPQMEFLEKRAKELGLSKEELAKLYIAEAIDAAKEKIEIGKKRFSLQGIVSAGTVTEKDIEEAKKIWQPRTLP